MPTPPFSPYVYDRVKEAEEKLARTNVAVKRTQEVGCRISTNYLLSVTSSPGHVCGHDQAAPRQPPCVMGRCEQKWNNEMNIDYHLDIYLNVPKALPKENKINEVWKK